MGIFLQVNGNKGLYPKDFIEENLVDALGSVSVVLTGIAPNCIWFDCCWLQVFSENNFILCHDGECKQYKTRGSIHDEIYRFLLL